MGYTSERNSQILISLLKCYGIRKIVASPGANNVSFVASVQQDAFFEVYSVVDERSALYVACGMALESSEPVIVTCTGATASRNYLSGLTEAFYRHIPIVAITYTQPVCRVGHNVPQLIDRGVLANDVAKVSELVPQVKDDEDEWECRLRICRALLELSHGLSGPVHLNVETRQSGTFDVAELPEVCPIDRVFSGGVMPKPSGRVAVFVGSHGRWDDGLTEAVDEFCERYDAVVIADQTSNYRGTYGYNASFASAQLHFTSDNLRVDTLIHLGDVSGAYTKVRPREVWRVSPDGELCDSFKRLRYTFEMGEKEFFRALNELGPDRSYCEYHERCKTEVDGFRRRQPELPFSNIWAASKLAGGLPQGCALHLGILNSLRAWNFFETPPTVDVYANTGGFGIDGCVSTLIGASLAAPEKLFFGVVGDLAFFYDMNVLGNRHVGSNVRVLVVNNGLGQEFKNYGHRASQFDSMTNPFIAADGHNGKRSPSLLRDYVTDLGFEYICASSKSEFDLNADRFLMPDSQKRPIVFELFTDTVSETEALKLIACMEHSVGGEAKDMVKKILGERGVSAVKKLVGK